MASIAAASETRTRGLVAGVGGGRPARRTPAQVQRARPESNKHTRLVPPTFVTSSHYQDSAVWISRRANVEEADEE